MIIVVEPHADDAYLSMGWHLECWGRAGAETMILTLFGNAKRNGEAAGFAAAVKARHLALGLEESGAGFKGGQPDLITLTELDIRKAVRAAGLPGILQEDPMHQIIIPLGIQHPEHRLVRRALQRDGIAYYVEIPYCLKKLNQVELNQRLYRSHIVSLRYPGARKARHYTLFKSQSTFFFYEPPEKFMRAAEIILRDVRTLGGRGGYPE